MRYNRWNASLRGLWLIMMIITPVLFVSGCLISAKKSTILVSREQQWTIPKGVDFNAIQKPNHPELTAFKADEDLMVLYKGKYLEEEKKWNDKAFKLADSTKKKATIFGVIGSALAFLAGLFGRRKKK